MSEEIFDIWGGGKGEEKDQKLTYEDINQLVCAGKNIQMVSVVLHNISDLWNCGSNQKDY